MSLTLIAGSRAVTGKQEAAHLTLLDRMRHVNDAGHLCGDRQGCMKGTRRDVISQLENWLNDEQDKRVFWLNGLAGTGKSSIAQTFAEMNFADGRLGASFFCSRYYEDKSNLRKIFPTLAFQLARRFPRFREELLPVLVANPDVGQEALCSQMEKLIIRPFEKTQIKTLIIIDALDECRDEEPASALLSVLSRYLYKIPFVKFFITGRPEPRIRSGFRLESLRPHTDILRLHEVKRSSVDSDIRLFFKVQLTNVAKDRSDFNLPEEWPSSFDLDILCAKAAGLFIFASVVVRFVSSKDHQPTRRLTDIIGLPNNTVKEGRAGIDQLYTEVLQLAFYNIQTDDGEFYSSFRSVVGAVVLVFNPLSVPALSDLLGELDLSTSLRSLHSLLIIPTNQLDLTPIHAIHKSFPDFLTNPQRCTDKQFFIDPPVHHRCIMLLCLRLMKERLKRNICQLDDLSPLSEVKDLPARKTAYIGDALGYACCFWASHLAKTASSGPGDQEVFCAIDEFFTTCFLFWIEVLSLMKKLDTGVYALNYIDQWYLMVSQMWSNYKILLVYLYLFSQEFHASGQMMANVFYWNTLIQYVTLLPRFTTLHFHFALPHPGFNSTTVWSFHRLSRWLKGPQLNGEHVLAQSHWMEFHMSFHVDRTLWQLALGLSLTTLLFLMQSQAVKQLFSPVTQIGSDLLFSHQMGDYLYLEVMTGLSSFGICRLVVLLGLSMATPTMFFQFLFQQIVPGLFQEPWIGEFVCGTFRQGSATIL